jgi:hypothetical protein
MARWLAARGVEAHVIHPSSVAVSREHRRAKTDRLNTELLKRGLLPVLGIVCNITEFGDYTAVSFRHSATERDGFTITGMRTSCRSGHPQP